MTKDFEINKIAHLMEDEKKKAILVGKDWLPNDYNKIVDESLLNVKFTPDTFQKQAFYFLQKNNSVFVAAHTSSGKTLAAEYAISLAQKNKNRVIYTSPIKALSNQKFYEFKQKFPDVGLITGDVQVNPNAECLIMTTEILRNFLYKNSDILRDTQFVVFDEVHYINNADRGVVWEECIIMMPKHISLLMLSATIPNALEFSEWVGRTKQRNIYVISTSNRAVPLEFGIFCDGEVFSLDDNSNNKKEDLRPTNFRSKLSPFSKKTKIVNKFKINDIGNYVNNRGLTPAIFFSFSRKACEEYGRSLQLLDLTTPLEKENISKFLNDATSHLREEDKNLPQIRTMISQVYRGVAVHHGALLPFVKECIEILFSENLIKILVATETFAMGVNMPAKCCVFLSLTKIDNGSFRYLNTGEFIQMSGRAGRRGMDKVGTILIADRKLPSIAIIKKIISGIQIDLKSQFKLGFSLILMAIRSNVDVQEMMRSSFKENDAQKNFNSDMIRLSDLESKQILECETCKDYSDFLNDQKLLISENKIFVKRHLKVGDVCILNDNKVVKVISINQNMVSYMPTDEVVNNGKIFEKRVNNSVLEKIAANNPKNSFLYPLKYRNDDMHDGNTLLDNVFFIVKRGNISFDYEETDIHQICKLQEIKNMLKRLISYELLNCNLIDQHYKLFFESKKILDEISSIKGRYSSESLKQIVEYSARIKFLTLYGFIDGSDGSITKKGRAAAEIRTLNEVVVVEMIFNNEFANFTPSEIVAVLSAMVYEENQHDFEIDANLQPRTELLVRYFDKLSVDLTNLDIPPFNPLNLSMVQAVYDWCQGKSLGNIVANYNVVEGTFVRLILRMEESCRELMNVAILIEDEILEEKISCISQLLLRDIIGLPSLYV